MLQDFFKLTHKLRPQKMLRCKDQTLQRYDANERIQHIRIGLQNPTQFSIRKHYFTQLRQNQKQHTSEIRFESTVVVC